jgi:hypothetical protein
MRHIKEFDQFIDETRDITDAKRGDVLVHDNTKEEVTVVDIISNTKLQVKNTKGESRIISPYYYSIKESFLTEGLMKELHIMADESKSEDNFVKDFFNKYGDKIKQSKDSIEWVKSLYKDAKK